MVVRDQRMSFGKRLIAALDAAGIPGGSERRKHVAQMFGVSREAVRLWLQDESMPTTKRIGEMAERLGVFGEWLLTGRGPMRAEDSPEHAPSTGSNVEPVPGELRWVPLISWVEAGWGVEAIAHLGPGETEEWLPCPAKCSPQTFALRVRGDSMLPDYREDEIVFVDPHLEPRHRDEVVVCNEQNSEATMKQLLIEGERRYLRALNRDYPEPIRLMTQEDRLCGVVIGLYRERR